jgi:hypothetical protein
MADVPFYEDLSILNVNNDLNARERRFETF